MNKETLESILRTFEKDRYDILHNKDFDVNRVLNGILSYLIENIKFEIDKIETMDDLMYG